VFALRDRVINAGVIGQLVSLTLVSREKSGPLDRCETNVERIKSI